MAGEKRGQEQEDSLLTESVILVDIEGTTTSISFVKETLFPYVRENLKTYVQTKWEENEFKEIVGQLKEQAKKDEESKVKDFVPISGATPDEEKESLIKNVLWQMDNDRKTSALKRLQGCMWRKAYSSGAVKGHIYEDVPKAFEIWANAGKKIYVYSSGSIEAQKLLFRHTDHGDLLKYFSGYFDTEVGMKQEAASYKNILNKIEAVPSDVLFLTDIVKEARAAKEAGLSTIILLREGNAPLTDEDKVAFTTVKSFLDLSFQTSAKRQKLDAPETNEKKEAAKDATKVTVTDEKVKSEDVEMVDVSEKKSAPTVETKEIVESEQDEKERIKSKGKNVDSEIKEDSMEIDGKIESEKKPLNSEERLGETEKVATKAINKEESNVKKCTEAETELVRKQPETTEKSQEKLTSSLTADEKNKATGTKVTVACEKIVTSGKEVKTVTSETDSKVTEPMDEGTDELQSKSENISKTIEDKTEETAKLSEPTKAETNKIETEIKSVDTAPADVKCVKEKETLAKSEEISTKIGESSSKAERNLVTEEAASKLEKRATEVAEASSKTTEESTKVVGESSLKKDVKENGTISITKSEKVEISTATKVVKEDSKSEAKNEVQDKGEVVAEKKTESEVEKKVGETKETELKKEEIKVESANEKEVRDEKSVEKSKQEMSNSSSKDSKEATTVDEAKSASNVAESADKKLNGTTQNGDSIVTKDDGKPHRNGLNEEESASEKSSVKTNEDSSAQNGEPESSSDASTESIKVKKVVDSTVAGGAGEPDVVPPVVVSATS